MTTENHVSGQRARSIEEVREIFGRMLTAEGIASALAFTPDPDDVIISPYAKCGTTWIQQIVHTLRSGGDMDFDDISRVVPWIETALDCGIDLDATQPGSRRAFKSHLSWDDVPKGARYIVAVRDPRDAALSWFRFFEGWFFEPGSIEIDHAIRYSFLASRNYYTHLASWWLHRHDDDVLLLAYEHMKTDLDGTVARIAEFIGIEADDDLLRLAHDQSTLEAMTANKSKYDEAIMRELGERVGGIPEGGESSKVASGQRGGHSALFSDELCEDFQTAWNETIAADFGIADYEDLLQSIS